MAFSDYPLLERERELEEIERALARGSSGEGLCLIIEGPAGLGKTRLLDAAHGLAQDEGYRVLGARAGEREREYSWGAVRSLLRADPDRLRPGGARGALVGTGGRRPQPARGERRLRRVPTRPPTRSSTASTGSSAGSPTASPCCSRSTTCTGSTAPRSASSSSSAAGSANAGRAGGNAAAERARHRSRP